MISDKRALALEARLEKAANATRITDTAFDSQDWDIRDLEQLELMSISECTGEHLAKLLCWIGWMMTDETFYTGPLPVLLAALHTRNTSLNTLVFSTQMVSDEIGKLNKKVFDSTRMIEKQIAQRLQSETENMRGSDTGPLAGARSISYLDEKRALIYRELNHEEDAIIITYVPFMAFCLFRAVTKPPETLIRNLKSTLIGRFKGFYSRLPKLNDYNYDFPSIKAVEILRAEIQQGNTPIRELVVRTLFLTADKKADSSSMEILHYTLLTHTKMAGLQIITMVILVSRILGHSNLFRTLSVVCYTATIHSTHLVEDFLLKYLEPSPDRPVPKNGWFKWAKLINPRYFANLSLKRNIDLGFFLACFSSESWDTDQCAMAVFSDVRLTTDIKKSWFKKARRIKLVRSNDAVNAPLTTVSTNSMNEAKNTNEAKKKQNSNSLTI